MLQNITKQSGSSGSQNNSVSHVTPTAIRNVADLFALVKQYDKNFSPKPASKIVNADGTPKVMYHGTHMVFYDINLEVDGKVPRADRTFLIKMSSLPRAHFSALNKAAKARKIRLQDDEITIADLFTLVKQYDKNFSPKPSSKIVNDDAKSGDGSMIDYNFCTI